MEWYSGSCVNVQTIAKDQEWLPSPDSLCEWETGPPQNLEWLDSGAGEFCQQIGNQVLFKDQFTVSDRNIWGKDISSAHSDFQLDNLEGIGRPNDMILNSSSSEDSAANKKFHTSYCTGGSGCECEGWPMDSFCSEAIDPSTEVQCMDSSDYCNSYFLSPSASWENGKADETLQHVPSCINENEADSPAKVPNIAVPCDSNDHHESMKACEATVDEISLEESVLQGLEMVTSQLTEETRICFRDALYRLADNSRRQQLSSENQHKGSDMGDDSSNSLPSKHTKNKRNKRATERRRAKESETNIIDRTVAKIMFDRAVDPQDYCAQEQPEHEGEEVEEDMFGEEHEMCIDSSSSQHSSMYQSQDHFQSPYNFGSNSCSNY